MPHGVLSQAKGLIDSVDAVVGQVCCQCVEVCGQCAETLWQVWPALETFIFVFESGFRWVGSYRHNTLMYSCSYARLAHSKQQNTEHRCVYYYCSLCILWNNKAALESIYPDPAPHHVWAMGFERILRHHIITELPHQRR